MVEKNRLRIKIERKIYIYLLQKHIYERNLLQTVALKYSLSIEPRQKRQGVKLDVSVCLSVCL